MAFALECGSAFWLECGLPFWPECELPSWLECGSAPKGYESEPGCALSAYELGYGHRAVYESESGCEQAYESGCAVSGYGSEAGCAWGSAFRRRY